MAARKSTARARARSRKPQARRQPAPDLDATLGHFNEALALAETTHRAFEAAEDQMQATGIGPQIIALRLTVACLRRVYTALDLAIQAVRP